jgi:predicted RNA-binding protein YlqC (UPF0109 family)
MIKNYTPKSNEREEQNMKDLVIHMAKSLVDRPDEVVVNAVEGESSVILELKVAQEDIGKVIGKQGRTAKAMRSILSACAKKQKKECYLKILE